jgi:hypothetical protein
VTVQPKPVRSSAPAAADGWRARTALPNGAGHRPRRDGGGESTIETHRRSGAPLSTVPTPGRDPPMRGRCSAGDGVGRLLSVFLAATLVMVTAVIIVGIVDRWWVLVPVMVVDVATTFAVVAYIARMLADDGESPA